ncbi:hypothetical protein K490DRAFT_66421 [Saccharata proteae CBS 121410]|uniref:Pre-mRNA-splicing factor CWC26 n=1 Tax=Saccharata proteae CBS 121410 TaxID=1314787 RepID=A0A9P4LWL6_9PEZI|nr:hypothetical protein K490DRAFT_66421 [Saccharata proteae CBS 121410]
MPSLADYLAKNYLNADPTTEKKSKKRKRKGTKDQEAGLIIADDDTSGWNTSSKQDDDGDTPMTVMGNSAEFRKKKSSSWKTVGVAAPSSADQAAADAIIAAAEQDSHRAGIHNDEEPTIVDADGDGPKMSSGAAAGLQTAAQVTAALAKRQKEEEKHMKAAMAEAGAQGQETIYRDASGRIINVAMKRAEARRAAEEEERKKQAELEAQKGDVQRAEAADRKQKLQDAKYMGVARYADDVEMNEELKERDRWADPALQAGLLKNQKKGLSRTGKPLYQGAAPPNRYNIRPGHKWDGVDRSNGFEKQWFESRNRRANREQLEYAWQMDE